MRSNVIIFTWFFVSAGMAAAGVLVVLIGAPLSLAQSGQDDIEALREKIIDRNKQLVELEKEIRRYQEELAEIDAQKQTLQTAISSLDVSRKKITTDIEATENRIEATDLRLRELELDIREKELLIERDSDALATAIRRLDELENASLLETLLRHDNLGDFWESMDELEQFQSGMRADLQELANHKLELEAAYEAQRDNKHKLAQLKTELSGEKQVLDANRKEKTQLLKVTQNEESNYEQLLQEKREAKERFLRELREFESQLKFALDPNRIPQAGDTVLAMPFEPSYVATCPSFSSALGNTMCVTQYFGNTPFASSGAYSGEGHNGMDFRASPGTKVTAALSGRVTGAGDTDQTPGCYSYGKWVLVEHANGLSTLYAHLSHISVAPGQQVSTGDLVGLSGNSGYSTGPHLHFTVYATDGVKVRRLGNIPGRPITGCSPVSIPVAATEAYLNPLNYLPQQ